MVGQCSNSTIKQFTGVATSATKYKLLHFINQTFMTMFNKVKSYKHCLVKGFKL